VQGTHQAVATGQIKVNKDLNHNTEIKNGDRDKALESCFKD
jgi:hypothetical protein